MITYCSMFHCYQIPMVTLNRWKTRPDWGYCLWASFCPVPSVGEQMLSEVKHWYCPCFGAWKRSLAPKHWWMQAAFKPVVQGLCTACAHMYMIHSMNQEPFRHWKILLSPQFSVSHAVVLTDYLQQGWITDLWTVPLPNTRDRWEFRLRHAAATRVWSREEPRWIQNSPKMLKTNSIHSGSETSVQEWQHCVNSAHVFN